MQHVVHRELLQYCRDRERFLASSNLIIELPVLINASRGASSFLRGERRARSLDGEKDKDDGACELSTRGGLRLIGEEGKTFRESRLQGLSKGQKANERVPAKVLQYCEGRGSLEGRRLNVL